MRFRSATVCGAALGMETSYSLGPIFEVPVGRIRFCRLIALTTSSADKPFDCNAVVFRSTIYIKAVAWVRDGFPPQTNIVRVNGQRSVLLTTQNAGNASTLSVIDGIKALLPQIKTTVPPQLDIAPLADQSIFVRGAISGVVRETLIA